MVNIYDSLGREELKKFFYYDFIGIVEQIVDEAIADADCNITDEYKAFINCFYAEAVAGTLLNWIVSSDRQYREMTVHHIRTVLSSAIPASIRAESNQII